MSKEAVMRGTDSLSFADRELRALGYSPESEGPDLWVYENVMELMRTFAKQGHSGFSANWVRGIFQKLADYQPLSPLTGADDEWMDVSEMGVGGDGKPQWQNRRCYSVFKDADGTCYNNNGRVFREPSGSCYTNSNSRVPVTFPYTPSIEYVDVQGDQE
jgi:hypothetical protein